MFYDNFLILCAEKKESPSGVARKIGLSNAAANGWKNGKIPSDVTLTKLAQYFGVTTDHLIGKVQKETAPTPEDERDVTFDDFTYAMYEEGKELTPENKEKLLEMARFFKQQQQKNKNP